MPNTPDQLLVETVRLRRDIEADYVQEQSWSNRIRLIRLRDRLIEVERALLRGHSGNES